MKKNIYIIISAIIIVVFAGFSAFYSFRQPKLNKSEFAKENIKRQAILIIDSGQGDIKNFNVEFNQGDTAFNLLEKVTKDQGIVLKTKIYDIGILINAIGEKENGQDGKYWLYYINGQLPMISADKQKLNSGDQVEFKFEKSPY